MPNINDFKSKLKGGGARANQFRVVMPFPGFASLGGETENIGDPGAGAQNRGCRIGPAAGHTGRGENRPY